MEASIRETGNNGEYVLQAFSLPVPGEQLKLEGFVAKAANRNNYFYHSEHAKKRIVIHHTAGQLRSDLSALTRDDYHVCVSYVIAREGTIYCLFPSKLFSGHLGKGLGNIGTHQAEDKATIGIELSNYGYLIERDGNLETVYSRQRDENGNIGPVDIYCSLTENEAYTKLPRPFRGQSRYANFTDEQYESLIILLRYLTSTHNIPRKFMDEVDRFETTDKVLSFNGIVSHINYRIDGKWDIGPAFNWNKVITGVQSNKFATTKATIAQPGSVLKSEKEIESLFPATRSIQTESPSYMDINFSESDAAKNTAASKPKLFALLVGVGDYDETVKLIQDGMQITFPKLRGPVDDAGKIKKMLEQDDYYEKDIKLITNKDATKPNVAKAFKEHLGKAGKGDVALFYYSGHGTQQWADTEAFTSETDGKLEAFICYYDKDNIDDFLLADKELRWLIHEVSRNGPHILTIFDCCHSAEITRNAKYVKDSFPEIIEKSVDFTFAKRPWEKFIFNKEITREDFIKKGEAKALPEGRHLQLSACESDESAVEASGEGVFTKVMLKVLELANGEITYYSLRNRIRQYLRNVFEQKPRIYVAFNDDSILYSAFLNKPFNLSKNAFAEVVYNKASGWMANIGAIHGLGSKVKTLTVLDPDDQSKTFTATVKLVRTDSAELSIDGNPDKNKVYKALIEGLMSNTLQINVEQQEGDGKERKALMDAILNEPAETIVTEDDEDNAQYVLRQLNGKYYITNKNEPYKPLTAPIETSDKTAPDKIIGQLKHIAKWEYFKNLTNNDSSTQLPVNTLKVEVNEVADNGSSTPLSIESNTARINFKKQNEEWANKIKIRLTNTSDKNIYVGALYLTSNFESFINLLNPTVYLLGKGESVELNVGGDPILPIQFDESMKWYNREKLTDYLKFIFSTEEFKVDDFVLDKLPPPPIPISERGAKTEKGIVIVKAANRNVYGWNVQELKLEMLNPERGLSSEDIGIMKNNEETADFAKKLYQTQMANGKPKMKEAKEEAPPEKPKPKSPVPQSPPQIERENRGFTRAKPPAGNGGAPVPKEAMANGGGAGGRTVEEKGGLAEVAEAAGAEPEATVIEKPKSKKKSAKPEKEPSLTRQGQIDYDIPGTMEVQKSSDCIIQIAGKEIEAAKLKVKETSVHAEIPIGNEMSVRIIDGSGGQFNITEISTTRQAIIPGEITRWQFRVFPKQAGRFSLILKVTMHTNGVDKDIDVLEKEILVNAGAVTPEVTNAVKRILFLAASPQNEARLRVGAEHDKINDELSRSGQRDKFVFSSLMAVTPESILRSIVQEDPYIIHFSGHGEEDGIILETPAGLSKKVTPAALKKLFSAAAKNVQCVLLNACYSADQAKSISEVVHFVIGMQQSIKDSDALIFSTGFYQAIAAGKTIQTGYDLGCAALALNAGGQNNPVLLKKA